MMKAKVHGVIGRGVKECYVNDENQLIFVMSDGKEVPIGFTGELKGIVPIDLGGTNAKNPAEARRNLEITPGNIGAATSAEVDVERNRINNLASLKNGSTTGDAELTDIRVGYNGTTYPTAGEAVRGQAGELNSDLINFIGQFKEEINSTYTIYNDKYYDKEDGAEIDLSGFVAIEIDLTNVDIVKIYGYQGIAMSGLYFVDSGGNSLIAEDGDMFHVPSIGGYNTIELKKPRNAVLARTCFSVTQNRTYEITSYRYMPSDTSKINTNKLADVIMIPIFGQSLSIGSASTPIISNKQKYTNGIMFNGGILARQKEESYFTEFVPLNEHTGKTVETVATGCFEKIIEQIQSECGISCYSEYWNNHKILFVSCGEGSKTISALASDYYAGLVNAIKGAKNICDANNYSLNIPCWIWIQGETDQKEGESTSKDETTATDLETYKTRLINLQESLNTECKKITGQTNDIKCICYQTCSQNIVALTRTPTYTNTNVMGVPTAQMQLVRDDNRFIASTPVYVLDHSTEQPIHLSGYGEKMLGLYCGLACKSVIYNEKSFTGLTPSEYLIDENTLYIKYNVPVPPMRFVTTWVKEVENKGFVLLNSNNKNIISSVSVFDDTVTIECTSSPLNAMLFYGFNGNEWKDGRKEGARGNLCDSAQFIFNGEIGGKRYTLSNYAYSFVKLLDSTSGTI